MDNDGARSCPCLPLCANYFVAKTRIRLSRFDDRNFSAGIALAKTRYGGQSGLTLRFEAGPAARAC
jgi:hypothetical protein